MNEQEYNHWVRTLITDHDPAYVVKIISTELARRDAYIAEINQSLQEFRKASEKGGK
jgi:hypothetical protein